MPTTEEMLQFWGKAQAEEGASVTWHPVVVECQSQVVRLCVEDGGGMVSRLPENTSMSGVLTIENRYAQEGTR